MLYVIRILLERDWETGIHKRREAGIQRLHLLHLPHTPCYVLCYALWFRFNSASAVYMSLFVVRDWVAAVAIATRCTTTEPAYLWFGKKRTMTPCKEQFMQTYCRSGRITSKYIFFPGSYHVRACIYGTTITCSMLMHTICAFQWLHGLSNPVNWAARSSSVIAPKESQLEKNRQWRKRRMCERMSGAVMWISHLCLDLCPEKNTQRWLHAETGRWVFSVFLHWFSTHSFQHH